MSKISRREFLRLSTVAAAGVAIAACAKTEEATVAPKTEPTATTAAKAEPTATTAPQIPAPGGEVPRNRTLVNNYGDTEFSNVGVCGPYANNFNHQHGMASELEFMFYYTALNDKFFGHLAESYEYDDAGTEMTVYLRKGVEWSDGTPFTANDIAFTYNSLIAKAPDLRDSSRVKVLTKEVIAVDDYTVKFVLNTPNVRYHDTECTCRFDRGVYIVPKHIYETVEGDWREFRMSWEDNADWPVVLGAYKRTEDTPTHKHFDLRPDWWAIKTGFMPAPEVYRVIQIGYSDDTKAAQMFINNEIDYCLDVRPRTIESILAQARHCMTYTGNKKPYGYVDWWPISMYFNTSVAPFTDKRVRWAIAYAVNQQQLVDVGWDGAGKVTYHPFPEYPGLMKYVDACKDLFEKYDVLETNQDKVDQLMTEAGFTKDGEGFWVDSSGARPDTNIWAGVPLFGDIAPVTAEQLRKAGFDSTHVTPPDVWSGKGDGRSMLHFFGHGGSVRDPFTTLDMYHIRNVKENGVDCGDNRPRWGNEEYSAIIDELSKTNPEKDPDKAQELFRKAMEIWLDELPEVPLVQWFHRVPINTTYWSNWPVEGNGYNTALWHITMPITLWNLKATNA
ncbi:MAG: ABC transporter substrate-binding protein [Anaerolineae bacterium]|nr:ABC transporter substrate-binding protein [Anaerolineae bacterium]